MILWFHGINISRSKIMISIFFPFLFGGIILSLLPFLLVYKSVSVFVLLLVFLLINLFLPDWGSQELRLSPQSHLFWQLVPYRPMSQMDSHSTPAKKTHKSYYKDWLALKNEGKMSNFIFKFTCLLNGQKVKIGGR